MKKHTILIWVALLGSVVISCGSEPGGQENVEADIRAVWDDFITQWELENAQGCALFYTEDGVNIPPGFKINKGTDEIATFYEFLFTNNQSSKYTHNIIELTHNGGFAVEQGEFRVEWINNQGEPWTFNARSLTQWQKNDNGEWKIKALMFNAPPAE